MGAEAYVVAVGRWHVRYQLGPTRCLLRRGRERAAWLWLHGELVDPIGAAEGDHRDHEDRRVPRGPDRQADLALRAPHPMQPLGQGPTLGLLRSSLLPEVQLVLRQHEYCFVVARSCRVKRYCTRTWCARI